VPREGVPYPERMLCSLKCELKNIWTALSGKLHSVNGVKGDGQGNVNIVSGDAAVVVTADPSLNQIKVSLDQSQLPAAAVSSVNGETGAVVLDASEIPYNDPDGYTDDVDEKLNVLTGVQNALQLSINQERTRAQNAEGTLQTNINTAQASIPGAAAAAVAADPTIASLVYADTQNVKLSGNQSIGGIKTVSTQATGSFDSQIANSSKVKNELDNYAPMMRLANTQQYTGLKQLVKSKSNLPPIIKINDYDGTVSEDNVYFSGITGSDNSWLETNRIGTDNNGNRAFYEKVINLSLNNTKYNVRMRWNITSSGLLIQFLDPINNVWRNVSLS